MTEKLPWMPFWGTDYYQDEAVRLMSLEEEAIYLRLLWAQWREGSLPADADDLAKLAGAAISARILARFPVTRDADGRRRNPKLETVRQQQLASAEARSRAGRAGREKQLRSGKRRAKPGQSPGERQPTAGHSESETEIETTKKSVSRTTWLTPFSDAWNEHRGPANHGRLSRVLRPLVSEHGTRQAALVWVGYLEERRGKAFCTAEDFAENYEHYRRKWGVEIGEDGTERPVPDEPLVAA